MDSLDGIGIGVNDGNDDEDEVGGFEELYLNPMRYVHAVSVEMMLQQQQMMLQQQQMMLQQQQMMLQQQQMRQRISAQEQGMRIYVSLLLLLHLI